MAKDYYVSLCQRKIRKTEKRIELCKKHLNPAVETADTISRNTIRIAKKEQLLLKWRLKLNDREALLKTEAEKAAEKAVEEVVSEVDEKEVQEQPAA